MLLLLKCSQNVNHILHTQQTRHLLIRGLSINFHDEWTALFWFVN